MTYSSILSQGSPTGESLPLCVKKSGQGLGKRLIMKQWHLGIRGCKRQSRCEGEKVHQFAEADMHYTRL